MSVQSLLEELKNTNALLITMAEELGRIAQSLAPISPNFRRSLAEFAAFDWSTINSIIIHSDADGPAEVQWNDHRYKRRSGDGKFGKAIWYSRPIGQSDDGTEYARLITFKNFDPAEPLAPGLVQSAPVSAQLPASRTEFGQDQSSGQAAAAHLKYEDGIAVPNDDRTITIFNSFLGAQRRKPKDADELRTWFTESTQLPNEVRPRRVLSPAQPVQ